MAWGGFIHAEIADFCGIQYEGDQGHEAIYSIGVRCRIDAEVRGASNWTRGYYVLLHRLWSERNRSCPMAFTSRTTCGVEMPRYLSNERTAASHRSYFQLSIAGMSAYSGRQVPSSIKTTLVQNIMKERKDRTADAHR